MKTNLISGAGNTFHITWKSLITNIFEQKKIARKICSTSPADGFIFLNFNDGHYSWNFYNNDGSDAEMCGNATRCVGHFIKNNLQLEDHLFELQTMAGLIEITSLNLEKFQIRMTSITEKFHPIYFYCDTGVPHIVIDFADFKNFKSHKDFCKNLRFHPDFLPRGTNVTLISKTSDPNVLNAVSYERGVEDFTQACGTVAMAAAYFNYKKNNQTETTVQMPGGNLEMNLTQLNQPKMTGPAVLIGEYIYDDKI